MKKAEFEATTQIHYRRESEEGHAPKRRNVLLRTAAKVAKLSFAVLKGLGPVLLKAVI